VKTNRWRGAFVFVIGLLCGFGIASAWYVAYPPAQDANGPPVIVQSPPLPPMAIAPPAKPALPPPSASPPVTTPVPAPPPDTTPPSSSSSSATSPPAAPAASADSATAVKSAEKSSTASDSALPPAPTTAPPKPAPSPADDARIAASGRAPDIPPKPADLATSAAKADDKLAIASPKSAAPVPPRAKELIIPVEGVRPDQLTDTYNDLRGGTRPHEALDIMAPKGTPVRATADGKIVKLFNSKPGGLTIYEFDPTETVAYYYAHLDRYAAGIKEGMQVRQGDVIGYVGTTGNAAADAPHLHFAIFKLGPEKHWWQGTPVNPYPNFVTQ